MAKQQYSTGVNMIDGNILSWKILDAYVRLHFFFLKVCGRRKFMTNVAAIVSKDEIFSLA